MSRMRNYTDEELKSRGFQRDASGLKWQDPTGCYMDQASAEEYARWIDATHNAAIEAAAKAVDGVDPVEYVFAGQTYCNGLKTLGAAERAIRQLRRPE